ncbi:MAG: protein kinase, partial [Pyrinomonadaceae bacterium]
MFRSGQQIGSYVLVQRIGRGGFGEVWLAERRAKFVTTKVAVKLPLDEQIDAETIKQEATLWEQASGHPNVLPIIDADEYDGQIVIVSEYAPDGSLEQFLKNSGGAIRPEKAIELTIGILSGLEFLHSRQIIHRDLKPANILLQGDTPRLADFGISRAMRTTSMSINVAGTPAYMSPEAFDGKRNAQTDIWSVGVILYQMLAGRLPFSQNSQGELLAAIIMREPEPPPATTPPALRQILAKALAKQPVARYKSAREMREDLNRFLYAVSLPTSEPTAALPQQTLFLDDSLQTINRETERKPLVNETPANYLTATKPSFPQDLTVSREDENNSVVTQIPAAQTDAARFFPTEAQAFAERTGGGKKNNLLFALISAGALILLGLIAIIGYNLSSSGGAAANKLSNGNNLSNANTSNPATNVKESSNPSAGVSDAGKNSIGMEFVSIPAGEFMMGSTGGNDNEKPVHKVIISK